MRRSEAHSTTGWAHVISVVSDTRGMMTRLPRDSLLVQALERAFFSSVSTAPLPFLLFLINSFSLIHSSLRLVIVSRLWQSLRSEIKDLARVRDKPRTLEKDEKDISSLSIWFENCLAKIYYRDSSKPPARKALLADSRLSCINSASTFASPRTTSTYCHKIFRAARYLRCCLSSFQ